MRCTGGSWKLPFWWIMRDFAYTWIREQPVLVRGPLCRETQITSKQCYSVCFSLSCYMDIGPRSVTWRRIAHEANRCTFWTSCSGVSWKRPFLSIMRSYMNTWLTEMQFLVGRGLHTGMENTQKISYLGCCFPSARDIWWRKGDTIVQKEPLCTSFMDTRVHKTEFCIFWTVQTFVPGKFSFNIIMHEFVHNSIT